MPNILQRLLGPREEKASTNLRTGAIMSAWPDAIWTPHDYAKIAKEGYQHNLWAFACVREITTAAKNAPLALFRKLPDGEREEQPENHPLLQLLRSPHGQDDASVTWPKLLEATIAYRLISGNDYLLKVGPTSRTAPPRRLYTLRPDLTKVRSDGGIEYGQGQSKRTFRREDVLHGKMFHPLDDMYGMGVIEAASRGIDTFNAGMEHNKRLLQNGARPASAWIAEGHLDDTQFERLKDQMRAFEGPRSAGKSLVLESGLKFQDLALTPHELDWLAGIKDAARQIHAAFGVHPVLTGLQEGTYENQGRAEERLYKNVVLPLMADVLTGLTNWLAPLFGDNLVLDVDKDQIEALSEDRDSLWRRTNRAYQNGVITQNEARAAVGYEEVDEGDTFRTQDRLTLTHDPRTSLTALNVTTEDAKAAYWKSFDQQLRRREERTRKRVRQALNRERASVMDELENATDAQTAREVALQAVTGTHVRSAIEEANLDSMLDAARGLRADVKAAPLRKEFEDLFGVLAEETLATIRDRAGESAKNVTRTMRQALARQLDEGIDVGESIPNLAQRVDGLFLEQIIPNRSEVIARTETLRASNYGSQQAAKATGLRLKKTWLATRDGRARDAHLAADGQTVAMDESFTVNGELLEYPGDPSASASTTVNCRCTQTFEVID